MKVSDQDRRRPHFLIMDNTPLSLLAMIGALDWLFVPGCKVIITDMVLEEATRDPGPGRDQRKVTRAYIARWFAMNRTRVALLRTSEWERYEREMELWRKAGMPEDLKPDWHDRGERSLLAAVKVLKAALTAGEEIIVIADDRDARDAVRAVRADIMLIGTRTFIRWLAEDFQVSDAETAWTAILSATNGKADPGDDIDPLFIRSD
ncbi:MAG: hypothetical protein JWL86_3832 [Rhizobium sp.]|nr:hypothetical protein [Rhizobium sp.]